MLALVIIGTVLFWTGARRQRFQTTQENEDHTPKFNPFIYSLDAFVPLINLHQEQFRFPKGRLLRSYLWIHIACGWVLTTLLVVGLTGLVRG